jgi:predicted permease
MENLALVVLCIAAGLLLRRVSVFGDAPQVLNAWVIWVALPAVVLYHLPRLHFDGGLLGLVAVPWIMLAVIAGGVLGLGRLFRWPRPTVGALLMLAPLGNTSFLGIPMLQALLGGESIPYALVYDQAGSFLAVVLYLPFVAAFYAGEGPFSWHGVVRRIFTFPPMIAALAVFLTWTMPRPDWLQSSLFRLSETLVPVAMVAVGLQLESRLPRGLVQPFVAGMVLKMGVLPLFALLLIHWLGMSGLPAQTALLEAAMPTMITAGMVAASHGLQPRLAAAMVGWGVILSFVTLPGWALIARGF